MMYNKYHNQKTVVDGMAFDSKKEARRYQELKLLEKAGEITDLKRQVEYELIPKQVGRDGKVIERKCSYMADFVYFENGKLIIEDAKGMKTDVYKIKKKLMLKIYGIQICEV